MLAVGPAHACLDAFSAGVRCDDRARLSCNLSMIETVVNGVAPRMDQCAVWISPHVGIATGHQIIRPIQHDLEYLTVRYHRKAELLTVLLVLQARVVVLRQRRRSQRQAFSSSPVHAQPAVQSQWRDALREESGGTKGQAAGSIGTHAWCQIVRHFWTNDRVAILQPELLNRDRWPLRHCLLPNQEDDEQHAHRGGQNAHGSQGAFSTRARRTAVQTPHFSVPHALSSTEPHWCSSRHVLVGLQSKRRTSLCPTDSRRRSATAAALPPPRVDALLWSPALTGRSATVLLVYY